jgi:toxin HigB-1
VIKTFADKRTAALFSGRFVKRLPPDVAERAKRKLDLIDAAAGLAFLSVPPGNRLEALSGDRAGQHSIRVNDQWRICFCWRDGNAYDVEFCDYHRG